MKRVDLIQYRKNVGRQIEIWYFRIFSVSFTLFLAKSRQEQYAFCLLNLSGHSDSSLHTATALYINHLIRVLTISSIVAFKITQFDHRTHQPL